MERKERNLYRLDELSDYKVASDYPDVRGWNLIDADNKTIGKIDNLIVNKTTERVVYLDVEVNEDLIKEGHEAYAIPSNKGAHEFINKEGEDHLILPIGSVSLDEDNKKVVSNVIRYETFANTDRFGKNNEIEREYEVKLLSVYYPEEDYTVVDEDDFYDRRYFKHNR
ncbi:PRC-barrel domain-containing protein [Flavobacterium rhizosphaerae]|uniref:PRC-barrel domain-containing protein n=1 Tax=Flavobacterium rhizosphaerae TaxID=3163298 RepID=A0ABW8YVV9_9FLAO